MTTREEWLELGPTEYVVGDPPHQLRWTIDAQHFWAESARCDCGAVFPFNGIFLDVFDSMWAHTRVNQ